MVLRRRSIKVVGARALHKVDDRSAKEGNKASDDAVASGVSHETHKDEARNAVRRK